MRWTRNCADRAWLRADEFANGDVSDISESPTRGVTFSIDNATDAGPARFRAGSCRGDELRAIKRYLATRTDKLPWLFVSERGQPLTRQAVNYLIGAAAKSAGLKNVHPHTLRHSCGFYLADKGTDLRTMQDYLGHRDPRHTVHYTRVSGRRFEGLWK